MCDAYHSPLTSLLDLVFKTSFLMFFLGTNVSGLRPESSSRPSNSLDYKWNQKTFTTKNKTKKCWIRKTRQNNSNQVIIHHITDLVHSMIVYWLGFYSCRWSRGNLKENKLFYISIFLYNYKSSFVSLSQWMVLPSSNNNKKCYLWNKVHSCLL